MRLFHLRAIATFLTVLLASSTVIALSVGFDVSPTVSCRDVTTNEFAEEYPDERLIQAALRISALASQGDASQFNESVYHFFAPERRVIVQDYLPKTSLVTDVVGNIGVQQGDDSSKSSQLSLGASYESFVRGELSGGASRNRTKSMAYELLPPRELLTTAGTMSRGSGVYFKLRGTPQTSLEGSHDFVVVFRVPLGWRADYLRAVCQARDVGGRLVGQASFLVSLYGSRDLEAKTLAEELHDHERQLVALANRYQKAVRRASQPTLAHELSFVDPTIPEDWLSKIITAPSTQRQSFEATLPTPIRSAVQSYRMSKQALARLPESYPSPKVQVQLTHVSALGVQVAETDAP